MIDILNFIRSLGFGAMLGSGTMGLIYIFGYQILYDPEMKNLKDFLLIGALLGGGLHSISNHLVNFMLPPALRNKFTFYFHLLEYYANPLINKQYKRRIIKELIESEHKKNISNQLSENKKKELE